MKTDSRTVWSGLWSPPDPVLAAAGRSGELFVARLRVVLSVLLLFIPFFASMNQPQDQGEGLIGLALTTGIFLFSAITYFLAIREFFPPWLSFLSSWFDVTLTSGALAVFLFLNEPHTAVNSKVVFEGYFLAIGSSSLRYDRRVCMTAGLLALAEYLAIVTYAAERWDLNSPSFAPFPYGMFGWTAQISRMVLLFIATVISVSIVTRTQRLLRLSTGDPLTGLFNRGYADDRLAIELTRARRHRRALTVAMMDVDRFKLFNDTHGHAAGDMVLRTIGGILRHTLRQSDTVARYGGEEFVILLPETEPAAAYQKLESLRQMIENTPMRLKTREAAVHVTISAGLAAFPEDGGEEADLLATADGRLFEAKRRGRNRVTGARHAAVNEGVGAVVG